MHDTSSSPSSPDTSTPESALETRWAEALDTLGAREAIKLWTSKVGPLRRTYFDPQQCRILKIALKNPAEGILDAYGELSREFRIVQQLHNYIPVPKPIDLIKTDDFQAACYHWIDAVPLSNYTGSFSRRLVIMARITFALGLLSLRGIAHNDLLGHNILITPQGKPYLIDFDKAQVTSVRSALAANFFRKKRGGDPTFYGSMRRLAREELWQRSPKLLRSTGRLLRRGLSLVRR